MKRRRRKKKRCYYQECLLENAKAGADGLTFEDKKSQAPAFPHSSQPPTNTAILGTAWTFASQVRGEGEGKRKRSSGKTCPVNLALSYKTPKLRETGVLSHPSDISLAPARSEKFFLLLHFCKWEGARLQSISQS